MTGMVHCLLGRSMVIATNDQDRAKGAVEQEEKGQEDNTSMQGQLGHRDQDPMLKAADSDFPEPGGSPEHTGEPEDGNNAA
jgi:hypothetical protein